MSSEPVRVLVVDDSALMRTLISHVLAQDGDIAVVDVARDGNEALSKIQELAPDVITLDVDMPEMNGLQMLGRLQGREDLQVVMLSGVTDPEVAYEALRLGALDFVVKPSGSISADVDDLGYELREKVRAAATVTHPVKKQPPPPEPVEVRPLMPVIVLVASTGGPMALESIVAGLPGDLEAAIVVVQHLPAGFSESLAARLGRASDLEVVEAQDGQAVRPARVYVGRCGYQLQFGRRGSAKVLRLTDGQGYGRFQPSADVALTSLAENFGSRGVGVVLTGMGSDGLRGMTALRGSSGRTLAQDRATSVVFGMPKTCIEAGVVDEVVSLEGIPTRLVELVRKR